MDSPILWKLFEEIAIDPSTKRPIYLQIADGMLFLIQRGKLQAGQKLPGSRDLATILRLNRITIKKAFEELQAQGWLESKLGRGTFVSRHLTDHDTRKPEKLAFGETFKKAGFTIKPAEYLDGVQDIDIPELHLDDGYPDPALAPMKELYRAYRSQLTRRGVYEKFGSYGNPSGSPYYRQTMSDYLNTTRSLRTSSRNILSTRGTLMGIHLVCSALITPGDIVVSGVPGWKRVEHNFMHAKTRHIGIPVDENGLVVEVLKKILKKNIV
ncbi:aminotransferase class I/II-fold pyridoxal phosphate-dependent enzyme [Pedobacter sp. GR22-6]|uniref:aminotransferase class I/II-fold pyridoxal phosphate-dependent enzyme n=1 Tax=Pedobacter sp. GR22-6 TaxID=3127957 RepID=UPI00307E542F